MTPDQWFELANAWAAAAWGLLAVSTASPLRGVWRDRLRWAAGRLAPGVLALGYVVALLASRGSAPAGGGFGSLQAVALLFSAPGVLLAGWVHYLAFDLLVGRWAADDAEARGAPAWRLLPCLLLIFMVGPAGWLAWLLVRGRARGPGSATSTPA